MTILQLQVLNWWSFSYIISANLFALSFHFFINQWRKNDHIYSSAALKKNINARSLTMQVRIFQLHCYSIHHCVVHGLCRSRFHSTRRKERHHVTWCLAKISHTSTALIYTCLSIIYNVIDKQRLTIRLGKD